MVNETDDVEADKRRAEVFDALGHPTRIMILKALSEGPQGFADLKKKLGIDSSGHLQHHLGKLDGLVKTDDYGKYTLSDQGKDALVSVETVEKTTKSTPAQNGRSHIRKTNALKVAVVALALLLVVSFMLATVEYNQAASIQNSINERDSSVTQLINQLNTTIKQRDTIIMQLDTALNLTQSRLNLNLPNGAQYLTTLPDHNYNGSLTKIFLQSAAAWYQYGRVYPSDHVWWFNNTGGYSSSLIAFELTNNRSIPLSPWGWTIGDHENYSYGDVGGGGSDGKDWNPYLMIGVAVRNDYTSTDAGNGSDPNAPIGNSTYQLTTNYVSFVNLAVKLISQDGSVIPADEPEIQYPPTARGGQYFPLENGETKQVVFYLYPSSLNIGGFEIYVSYLSSVPQF